MQADSGRKLRPVGCSKPPVQQRFSSFPTSLPISMGLVVLPGQAQDKRACPCPDLNARPPRQQSRPSGGSRPEGPLQPAAGEIEDEKRFIEQTENPSSGTGSMSSLDRVGRIRLRWPLPAEGIAAVVRIGGTHPVDHRAKHRNPGTVKLPSGALDLGSRLTSNRAGQQCSVGPAAQDQSVRDRQDRGESR